MELTEQRIPKNPVIAAFFRQIGRADELGSGMRNLIKYGKAYGGTDPEMIEGDVFRIIVKGPDGEPPTDTQEIQEKSSEKMTDPSRLESRLESRLAAKVVIILQDQPSGKAALAGKLGHKTVSGELHKQIRRLVDQDIIEMTIPDKPHSSNQKYRLTEKGRAILKELSNI